MLWLAWEAWQARTREFAVNPSGDRDHNSKALRSGIVLSLTNPQNVAYWAAMGSALGAVGVQNPTVLHYSAFFTGFMMSSIVWAFLFAALVDRLLGGVGVRWAQITYRACAIAFLALALSSFRELWVSLSQDRPAEAPSATSAEP